MSKNILKIIVVIAIVILITITYGLTVSEQLIVNYHKQISEHSQIVTNASNNSAYDSANDTTHDSIILTNMALYNNSSYNLPNEPSYILRLDDVQIPAWSDISMRIIDDTLSKNMSLCIAIIPNGNEHDTAGILGFIRERNNNSHLEIAQHGFNHNNREYDNISADETQTKTTQGLRNLYKDYGAVPITFIPPNNEISSRDNSTVNTLRAMGFRIISTRGDARCEGNILNVGCNVVTKWGDKETLKSPEEIIGRCKQDFERQNLSVIMIHPQDFVKEDRRTLDPVKYANYLELLDELNKTGAQSITFRDLLTE